MPPSPSPPPFEIHETAGDGHVVLAVSGELDLGTTAVLQDRLDALRAAGTAVRIDVDGLTFVDSTGIRILLGGAREAAAAGQDLSISRGSAALNRLVAVLGMEPLLPFAP
jgi:anti-anti-sigma factor